MHDKTQIEIRIHEDVYIKTKIKYLYVLFNPLYTGGFFHCYLFDESTCHFRGVESYFVAYILLFQFDGKSC